MTGSALGGNMIRSRLKKMAIVAGASAVVTAGILAVNPFSASAADAPATTTTVTGPATIATGHAATFIAAVSPSKTTTPPVVKATGAVTFTITGHDASSVSCTNVPALSGKGKFTCKVAAGSLLASASPYTVTASYAGDGGTNFGPSSDTISQIVSAATAHVKLAVDSKPVSGSPSTFTATVTGGGGALPTGNVVFTVAANGSTAKTTCASSAKGNTVALSPSSGTPPVAQAVCSLQAGWVKTTTTTNTAWTVVATYKGDSNFAAGAWARMTGTAKS
jgi:hypothetical protein